MILFILVPFCLLSFFQTKMENSKNSSTNAGGRACFESIYGPPKGQFLETTHGTTHYILEGNGNRNNNKNNNTPLIVLIHGIGGNLGVYDSMAADLVNTLSCQVLRYDLYDRGYR